MKSLNSIFAALGIVLSFLILLIYPVSLPAYGTSTPTVVTKTGTITSISSTTPTVYTVTVLVSQVNQTTHQTITRNLVYTVPAGSTLLASLQRMFAAKSPVSLTITNNVLTGAVVSPPLSTTTTYIVTGYTTPNIFIFKNPTSGSTVSLTESDPAVADVLARMIGTSQTVAIITTTDGKPPTIIAGNG